MGLRGPILRLSDRSILGENGTNIGFNYFLDEVPLDSHETRSISLLQLLLEGCKNRLQMLIFLVILGPQRDENQVFRQLCHLGPQIGQILLKITGFRHFLKSFHISLGLHSHWSCF